MFQREDVNPRVIVADDNELLTSYPHFLISIYYNKITPYIRDDRKQNILWVYEYIAQTILWGLTMNKIR